VEFDRFFVLEDVDDILVLELFKNLVFIVHVFGLLQTGCRHYFKDEA
jgi:hypothetical protein